MVLTDYFIPSTSFTVVNVTGMHDNLLNNTVTNQLFTPQEMVFGDFLVIIGGVAYAASNVLQQYLILKYGITEFLCCVGLVASVTTLVYTIIFEQQAVSIVFLSVGKANLGEVIGCFVGYALSMFLLYSLMPFVLARSSAVLVNLSLLTADIYAVLMGVYIFHYGFHYLYILCFLAILFGVCLFNVRLPVIVDINKRQTSSFCQSILRRRRRLESNKQHFDRQQIG
ncbi:unnamed protein product [Heterobilharzia americana]|nr:unnamed protein product [Heterobilharzia americana]